MNGTIRCAGCGKNRDAYVCSCGAKKCYIALYWKGRLYQYRRDTLGTQFGFFEAERFLTELRAKIDRHNKGRDTFSPIDYLTSKIQELKFKTQIERWFSEKRKEVARNELSPGTLDTYESYYRTHWYKLDDIDVRDIGAQELKAFNLDLSETLRIKTRRSVMNALQGFLRWLWREEIIKAVPPFPMIRGNDASPRHAITFEAQEEALLKIPDAHRDLFTFGFETGLRSGELAAVKVKDIDHEAGNITVQRTYASGNILRETTKGRKKATIPLSERALAIARKQGAEKLPESFLFIRPDTGRGYLPQAIWKLWTAYAGMPLTYHEAARHSFCTQVAKSGAHPEQQRRLMRHSDIRTTMRYTHMDVSDLREIVNNRGNLTLFETFLKSKKNAK